MKSNTKYVYKFLIFLVFSMAFLACSNLSKDNPKTDDTSTPQPRAAFDNVININFDTNPPSWLAILRQYVRDNFVIERQPGAGDDNYTSLCIFGPDGCAERPGLPNYFIVTVTFRGLERPFAFVIGTADLYIQGYIPVYNRNNPTQNVYYYYRDNRPNPNAPRIRAVPEATREFELDLGVEYVADNNTLINRNTVIDAINAFQAAAYGADGRRINLPGGSDTSNIFGTVFAETIRINPVYQQIQAALQPNDPGIRFGALHTNYLTNWGGNSQLVYDLGSNPSTFTTNRANLLRYLAAIAFLYIAKVPKIP
jgi:hypothetical protein